MRAYKYVSTDLIYNMELKCFLKIHVQYVWWLFCDDLCLPDDLSAAVLNSDIWIVICDILLCDIGTAYR